MGIEASIACQGVNRLRSEIQVVENAERTSDMGRVIQPMKGKLSPSTAKMKNIQEELEKALAAEI